MIFNFYERQNSNNEYSNIGIRYDQLPCEQFLQRFEISRAFLLPISHGEKRDKFQNAVEISRKAAVLIFFAFNDFAYSCVFYFASCCKQLKYEIFKLQICFAELILGELSIYQITPTASQQNDDSWLFSFTRKFAFIPNTLAKSKQNYHRIWFHYLTIDR